MKRQKKDSIVKQLKYYLKIAFGAAGFTLLFFLVLPLIQTITKPPATDLVVRSMETANIPPPPPLPEEEPEKEPEPEEPPPELTEKSPPLDLSQLELALDPGLNESLMGGDFFVKLNTLGSGGNGDGFDADALFSLADLDQKPRVVYQPAPAIDKHMRKKAPGTVYLLFVVSADGRVEMPVVQSSTDPVFDKPALSAIRQWKFEPGKRNGKPVRFRMRVPITFPKG